MNDQEKQWYVPTPGTPANPTHDLIPIDEFIGFVHLGSLTDAMGYAEYANPPWISNKRVSPSEIAAGRVDRSFTHVAWYNW